MIAGPRSLWRTLVCPSSWRNWSVVFWYQARWFGRPRWPWGRSTQWRCRARTSPLGNSRCSFRSRSGLPRPVEINAYNMCKRNVLSWLDDVNSSLSLTSNPLKVWVARARSFIRLILYNIDWSAVSKGTRTQIPLVCRVRNNNVICVGPPDPTRPNIHGSIRPWLVKSDWWNTISRPPGRLLDRY